MGVWVSCARWLQLRCQVSMPGQLLRSPHQRRWRGCRCCPARSSRRPSGSRPPAHQHSQGRAAGGEGRQSDSERPKTKGRESGGAGRVCDPAGPALPRVSRAQQCGLDRASWHRGEGAHPLLKEVGLAPAGQHAGEQVRWVGSQEGLCRHNRHGRQHLHGRSSPRLHPCPADALRCAALWRRHSLQRDELHPVEGVGHVVDLRGGGTRGRGGSVGGQQWRAAMGASLVACMTPSRAGVRPAQGAPTRPAAGEPRSRCPDPI